MLLVKQVQQIIILLMVKVLNLIHGLLDLHQQDNPKIAVAVIVENGGYGASAAAPIAGKVINSLQ